jgi:hypothetical protein
LVSGAYEKLESAITLYFGERPRFRPPMLVTPGGLPIVLDIRRGKVDLRPVRDAIANGTLPPGRLEKVRLVIGEAEEMSMTEFAIGAFEHADFLFDQLLWNIQAAYDLKTRNTDAKIDKSRNDVFQMRVLLQRHLHVGLRALHKPRILHYANDVGRTGGTGRLVGLFGLPSGVGHFAVPVASVR